MAVPRAKGVPVFANLSSRQKSWTRPFFIAVLLLGLVMFAAPARADAQGNDPKNWDLPDNVVRTEQTLYWTNASGDSGFGSVGPGRTFFSVFTLQNTGSDPVTVTGFNSNFIFQMDPSRQGDRPDDHCMQFIEVRPSENRVNYPKVIEPGETVRFADAATYHYIYGPPSNECQNARFFFGPPTFQIAESVTPSSPEWGEASCDAEASIRIPETPGVTYAIDGTEVAAGDHTIAGPQSVTVTAAAGDGFEFPLDTVAQWTHTFTAAECTGEPEGPEAPEGPEDPTPQGDESPAESQSDNTSSVSTLPATGAPNMTMHGLVGLFGAGLGGTLLLFGNRRLRR